MAAALKNISIIVLTYNRHRLLKDCLHSLLAQTYPHEKLEIVVSDDGSYDKTHELVTGLQSQYPYLRYFYQRHKGIAAARNNGIVHATGEIVAIVADDYILDATYGSTIAEFFHLHPEAMVVRFKVVAAQNNLGSQISHFYFDTSARRRLSPMMNSSPRSLKKRLGQAWQKIPTHEETITTQHDLEAAGAAAFRREVFSRVGLFDESLQRAEDMDMTLRLRKLGIPVYYNPYFHVRHQYNPFLLDTFYKCFNTGRNRYKFYQKHKLTADVELSVAGTVLQQILGGALAILWKARQGTSTAKILFYLPFMGLFEATNKLGFLWSMVSDWLGSRPRLRQHETEDDSSGK